MSCLGLHTNVHFTYKLNHIYFADLKQYIMKSSSCGERWLILYSLICRTSLRWFRELPTLKWDSFWKPNLTQISFGSFNTIDRISFQKYTTLLTLKTSLTASLTFNFFYYTCNLPLSSLVLSFHLLALCVASQLLVLPVSSLQSDRSRPEDHPVSTCPSQSNNHFNTNLYLFLSKIYNIENWKPQYDKGWTLILIFQKRSSQQIVTGAWIINC